MPKSVRSFDRITIPAPCDADWDEMIGNDQVRFCEHCNLHVTNLSAMTRTEAMHLVAQSRGRLCVRFIQLPGGGVLTKDLPEKLHLISRRVSRVAAGAFTAAVSLSTAAAQIRSDVDPRTALQTPAAGKLISADAEGATVSGIVKDPNGALVPNALITLTHKETSTSYVYTTVEDGIYRFSLLPAGSYQLAAEAPSFAKTEGTELDLLANASRTMDIQLQIPSVTAEVEVNLPDSKEVGVTMGMVAISEPQDPLIRAAHKDDLAAVVALLPLTVDVNASDKYTNTNALSYAIENHNPNMVNVLLSAGANLNQVNEGGRTPLMYLNDAATVEFVRELISRGANVDASDESGETVLSNAVSACKIEVVKELINAGGRIDTKDDHNTTILMRAALNEDDQVARFLIEAGASIDAENTDGESALTFAARAGKGSVLKLLIDKGATINLTQTDLDNALLSSMTNEDSSVVKILLQAGASANAKDRETTALMRAVQSGKPETIRALIDAGAELNAVDEDGWTAVMHADSAENVLVLVNAGVDLTIRNRDGLTALGMASKYDQEEIVKLLKSRGAPE